MGFPRWIKNSGKRQLRRAFELGQRVGVDILPRHFYSSIPDIRFLKSNTFWRKRRSMVGVRGASNDVDLDAQVLFVRRACTDELRKRLDEFPVHARAVEMNGEMGYGPTEAEFLYCFIRTIRPPRIVQVGAGVSTAIILLAAADSPGYSPQITCVDPFPTAFLIETARAGRITLRHEMAQTVDLSVFTDVGPDGFLFIDSTHTVKPDSEVNRLILEVLPRLVTGTHVHFHDIFFPYDYPRAVLTEPFFPAESTLLHAYLADNARYSVLCSLSMLHYARQRELREALPHYRPRPNGDDDGIDIPGSEGDFPSAIYLRATA
jgi:predicted O-methyltransferase YrrM